MRTQARQPWVSRAAARALAGTLLLATLAAAASPASALAATGAPKPVAYASVQPRAIIVLVDCATLADVTRADLPGFSAMRATGSMGLSTIPLGVGAHNEGAHATIGQGSPVSQRGAPPQLASAFESAETVDGGSAAEAYVRNTGMSPGDAALVNPQIVALTKTYASAGGGRMPGLLGESLRAKGLGVALLGDADGSTPGQLDRSAALVAMNASGTVPAGALGRNVDDAYPRAPLGMQTNFARLFSLAQDALATSSLVVIETGDLQRARLEAPLETASAAAAAHDYALRATDEFVGRVAALASPGTLVLVVATSVPSSETGAGRSLAPVLVAGGGFPAGGALASPTTRRAGVITLHDLAPTVLAHLGVAPASPMVGLRVTGRDDADAARLLTTTLQRAGALHSQRIAAINAFIALQTLLLLALCVPWVQRRVLRGPRAWWALPCAAGATALAIVLQPTIGSPALPVALAAIVAIAAAAAAALAVLRDRVLALALLATATIGALALDLAAGTPLARWSYLGYDIVVGGRFYGASRSQRSVPAASRLSACSRGHDWAPTRAGRSLRPLGWASPSTASRAGASRGAACWH